MKKTLLMLISMLPFASLSMAASIKLNEISQEEKVQLIREVLNENPYMEIDSIKSDDDVELAIQKLIQNGYILDAAKVKKGSGGESVGGR